MTLFNKKAKQDDQIDRISDLPCNVIDDILAHLEVKDLVRTSVLSKKWRNMWTSAPQLSFGEHFIDECEHFDDPGLVASKIITDVLMQHNGPVHKFTLLIDQSSNYKIAIESIDMWIEFLSMRNIKHLELGNCNPDIEQISCPISIFSCKELTYFRFGGFNLSIPPNFRGFKRLLELRLEEVTLDSSALESLISGCPLLEKLSILCCTGFEYVDFSAPSLKVLNLVFNEDVKSICLKKAHNLIDLELHTENGRVSGLIKSLPKIKRFSMQSWNSHETNKTLYADMIPPTLLKSSFSTLEYLNLDDVNLNERGELLYIVSVLKSAPSLVKLVIKSLYNGEILQAPNHSEEHLECNSCCLNQLQTVNIYIRDNSHQYSLSLIRFILANSTSLKTLTFSLGRGLGSKKSDALLRISQKLLWMERASPKAHIKFTY